MPHRTPTDLFMILERHATNNEWFQKNWGPNACYWRGMLSSFPRPGPPRRPPSLCSPSEPLSSKLHFPASAGVCLKRDHQQNSSVGLAFSVFSSLPLPFSLPLFLCLLSSPLSLNLLHCSWTSLWIKTLSKNPLFKVISNFSARLSEICLFEGRIRCDRRFIVT